MNKRHLAVAVVAVLALSSSTVASAQSGSHRKTARHHHISSLAPIGLRNFGGVLTIDTSSATPSFAFDTTTAVPHIDFDLSESSTHFDTSTATSSSDNDGVGQDDFLRGTSPSGLVTPPAVPGTPPTASSWITKPHAKSNDDNGNDSGDSQD